jgi:hypothetical protein
MRAVLLLFMSFIWGALLCSTAPATEPLSPRQKPSETAAPTNPRKAVAKPGHGSVPLPKPAARRKAANNTRNSGANKIINSDRHIFAQRKNPASANLSGNRSSTAARLVHRSPIPRPAASTANTARHHGPNPAIIGGAPNIATANSAGLSGTTMRRRSGGITP